MIRTIMDALVRGAVRRAERRSMRSIGVTGWKMDLYRVLSRILRDRARR